LSTNRKSHKPVHMTKKLFAGFPTFAYGRLFLAKSGLLVASSDIMQSRNGRKEMCVFKCLLNVLTVLFRLRYESLFWDCSKCCDWRVGKRRILLFCFGHVPSSFPPSTMVRRRRMYVSCTFRPAVLRISDYKIHSLLTFPTPNSV